MCDNTRIDIKSIMLIIANLRHIEFLLGIFDNSPHNPTLGEIRQQFEEKFETLLPLLNQWFGIYRLMPLILIKEEYRKQEKELSGDIKTIKIIRDAVVHGQVSIEEEGYIFCSNDGKIKFTYEEFSKFIDRIENEFYKENKKLSDISKINKNLKCVEFLLGIFDNSPHNPTLGEIRQRLFEENFETLPLEENCETLTPLSNQWFGIYRLTPLILIKAVKEHTITKEISDDLEFVRNAVAHGRFSTEEEGYIFSEKKKKIQKKYTYEKIVQFIDEIEKIFHKYYKDSKK